MGVATTNNRPRVLDWACTITVILVLTGCATDPPPPKLPPIQALPEPIDEEVVPASTQLPAWERFQQAKNAHEYRLAERIAAEMYADSQRSLNLPAQENFEILQLYTRLLAKRSPEAAIRVVRNFHYQDPELIPQVNLLLAELYQVMDSYVTAMSILQELGNHKYLPMEQANSLIWELLHKSGGVYNIDWSATEDPYFVAWGELALLYREHFSSTSLRSALEAWRQKYLDHNVSMGLPSFLRALSELENKPDSINNLAVVLPQAGPMKSASNAIKSGLLLAYMEDLTRQASESSFNISFYDSYDENPITVINRAFTAGADLVVGFIDKDHIQVILDHDSVPGPVLLLNRVQSDMGQNSGAIRQFALSIEDEIAAIVAALTRKEQERIILFSGNQPWAIRARNSFLVQFEKENRIVTSHQVFLEPTEIFEAVGKGLAIDQSNERLEELQRLTRAEFEFVPRRRLDVDAIVAFVNPSDFESMLAALNYHYAGDIPLYVTETAVRAGKTSEFNSTVHFTATPWLIEKTVMRDKVQETFGVPRGTETLYAFGIDIFRIVKNWHHFETTGWLLGSTGTIQLQPNGVITRLPIWGQLNNQTFGVARIKPELTDLGTSLNLPNIVR